MNTTLFRSFRGFRLPRPDARNHEGAPAYALSDEQALAQIAATGCFNGTFYADGAEQLDDVLALAARLDPAFVARTAVYARTRGHMKDTPAVLLAALAAREDEAAGRALEQAFPLVVDSGRMLRGFVQAVRSGVTGRRSLGSRPKRLVRAWLADRSGAALFRASVGQQPSLADVIKMVHPRPATPERAALYGYLLGRPHDAALLPPVVQAFEAYKADRQQPVPDVPFQMLTALDLDREAWTAIALQAPWHTTRMNLRTFARHGVFESADATAAVAARLRDPEAVRRARAFPYQLLVAYKTASADVPAEVREALQDAMEVATENVPAVPGGVYVCPDVSGSMQMSVTGYRRGATSAVRCVDVAALVAAAFVRRNRLCGVLPFEQRVVPLALNARDSVMTNAQLLASVGGGGTSCSAPLAELNKRRATARLVVLVSDNESWVDASGSRGARGTALLREWAAFRQRNPEARLVCLDLVPNRTTQAASRPDILNVGGFSDAVFRTIAAFAEGDPASDHWVREIDRVEL